MRNIVHKDQYVSISFIKENPLNKQVSSLFSEAQLIAEYFMIEFQNVSYAHSKGYGVNNLNMTIEDGDFTFLIGPTGSGKTTFMRLIYFDLLPDTGLVKVNGYMSSKVSQKMIAKARRSIGMVFQDYKLLGDRNLFDNVALPLHVLGFGSGEIPDRVDEALELVGLDKKAEHLPHELSGGEQQRACLARAIIKEPDVILADEPTGNLDPVASFELVRLLETIHETGTTILMASHNYNLIKGRGRPIYEIKDGILRVR